MSKSCSVSPRKSSADITSWTRISKLFEQADPLKRHNSDCKLEDRALCRPKMHKVYAAYFSGVTADFALNVRKAPHTLQRIREEVCLAAAGWCATLNRHCAQENIVSGKLLHHQLICRTPCVQHPELYGQCVDTIDEMSKLRPVTDRRMTVLQQYYSFKTSEACFWSQMSMIELILHPLGGAIEETKH